MCSVQIFKFLAKIYIINLIFSQEYIFIAFSQESAFSFSQVSNTHLAKIYTTRIRVPEETTLGYLEYCSKTNQCVCIFSSFPAQIPILKPDVEAICLALDDASGAAPVEEEDVLPPQVAVAQHAEGV